MPGFRGMDLVTSRLDIELVPYRGSQRGTVQTRVCPLFYNPAVLALSNNLLRLVLPTMLLGASACSQNATAPPAPESSPKSTDPELVTCGDKPPLASRTVRGNLLVSPDGRHRAYVEVEATALYPQRAAGYTGPLCVNNSRLFVAAETEEFKLRFLQEPGDVENGNSLRVLDWSADSRRLLAELAEWQYEQPGTTRGVLIYDSRYGTFQQPDLGHALAKAYGRDCSFNFRVLGFGAQGAIVLEAQPLSPEEEEISGLSSCAKKRTFFSLDRTTETMVSVPELPKVQHNAKVGSAQQ
jgi:hypothetical protein